MTQLCDLGMDEQLIAVNSGYRLSAVCSSKRTQDVQFVKYSEIIHETENDESELRYANIENIWKSAMKTF